MRELKPCPFCGKDKIAPSFAMGDRHISAGCWSCEATGPDVDYKGSDYINEVESEATKKWNTRPIEDELKAEIEELRSTICLFNSMILSGEKHTSISLAMLESALKTKVKVCKKEGDK